MENLPEALISAIIKRVTKSSDRNSLPLVSKQLYKIEADQRCSIRVGCGLDLVTEAVTKICLRFPNLTKIEIIYSRWEPNLGKQLDDECLFILFTNCPSLTDLSLRYCSVITDSGLSYLVSYKKLENLSIVKCRAINENSLAKLGNCLRRLKCLEFKLDLHKWNPSIDNPSVDDSWLRHQMCCERLKELCFTNCDFRPERGSSLILESCGSLEKVCLDKFTGLYDSDIISLSNKSRSLKSISLEQSSVSALTDASLKAPGSNCPFLENVELDFVGFTSWSPSLITIEGILALINGCPIRVLVLKYARFLNDSAMETLSLAYPCLETLEIERPHIVTDLRIGFVVNFPRLVNLKITWCCSITNDGLKLLIGSETLHHLMIKNCPRISEQGVQGAARHVCYEQVLPRRC